MGAHHEYSSNIKDHHLFFSLIHTGHILNALGGPVLMAGPPLVSATWFPVEHRTLATAFTTCLDNLGTAVAFILGEF